MPVPAPVRRNFKPHTITVNGLVYVDIHRLIREIVGVYPVGEATLRRLARLGEIPSIRVGKGERGQKFWFNLDEVLTILTGTVRATAKAPNAPKNTETVDSTPKAKITARNSIKTVEMDYDPFIESLGDFAEEEDPLAGI